MNVDHFTTFLGQYGVAVRYLIGGYRYGQPYGPPSTKRLPLQPTEEFDLKLLGDIADALHNIGRPNGIEYFNQAATTINQCWFQSQSHLNPITAGLLPIPPIEHPVDVGTCEGTGLPVQQWTADHQAAETAGRMYEACDIIRAIGAGALKTVGDVRAWADKSATSCEQELRNSGRLKGHSVVLAASREPEGVVSPSGKGGEPRGTVHEEVNTSPTAAAMSRLSTDAILPTFRGRIIFKDGKQKPLP